jgi:hypothetical protein
MIEVLADKLTSGSILCYIRSEDTVSHSNMIPCGESGDVRVVARVWDTRSPALIPFVSLWLLECTNRWMEWNG